MRSALTTIQETSPLNRGRELPQQRTQLRTQQRTNYQLERWLRETGKQGPWPILAKSQAPLSDQRVCKLLNQAYSRTSTDIGGCESSSPSDDSLRILSNKVIKALSG